MHHDWCNYLKQNQLQFANNAFNAYKNIEIMKLMSQIQFESMIIKNSVQIQLIFKYPTTKDLLKLIKKS